MWREKKTYTHIYIHTHNMCVCTRCLINSVTVHSFFLSCSYLSVACPIYRSIYLYTYLFSSLPLCLSFLCFYLLIFPFIFLPIYRTKEFWRVNIKSNKTVNIKVYTTISLFFSLFFFSFPTIIIEDTSRYTLIKRNKCFRVKVITISSMLSSLWTYQDQAKWSQMKFTPCGHRLK